MPALLELDAQTVTEAIARSCQIKAAVVAEDEREGGVRAILNLGHTFGHAIEAHQGYGQWLHGEAVGAGMVMALQMSARQRWISDADAERCISLIAAAGLPTAPPPTMQEDDFMRLMAVDKKVLDGQLRLVLLKQLGHAVVTADYDVTALRATLG